MAGFIYTAPFYLTQWNIDLTLIFIENMSDFLRYMMAEDNLVLFDDLYRLYNQTEHRTS